MVHGCGLSPKSSGTCFVVTIPIWIFRPLPLNLLNYNYIHLQGIPREICVPEWNGYLESSHMRMPQVPLLSNLIFCIYRGLLSILSPDDGENYDACDLHIRKTIQKMVIHQYPHTSPLYPWCHYNMMDWFLESQGSMMKCSCLMDYGYCIFFIHSHMFGWLKLVKIPKKIQVAV